MTPLKEMIINYILTFISERNREVRICDLFDIIMKQFGHELKENCNDSDNPFSDEMFVESIIHETYRLYGLTYTEKDGKMIGLNEEGRKAADHVKGISGYLCEKEKERKLLKLQKHFQVCTEITSVIIALVTYFIDYLSPISSWSNNLVFLVCGAVIGIGSTHLFGIIAKKRIIKPLRCENVT